MEEAPRIIICERSILTDKHIFAKMLHDTQDMEDVEWELYNNLFNSVCKNISVAGLIYISTSATTSNQRIHERNRAGEDNIPIEYLNQLHHYHQQWVRTTNLQTLTLSTETNDPDAQLEVNINKIREFISRF
jgi:deoxyadenosine/deoxycytidine kinase